MSFFSSWKAKWHGRTATPPPPASDADYVKGEDFIAQCERETEFEKRFLAQLSELEHAILTGYVQHQELTDRQVDMVLEAVLDALAARALGRPSRQFHLNPVEQDVYDYVWESCTILLDASKTEYSRQRIGNPFPFRSLTIDELKQCLKRIRTSIRHWGNDGGVRAYLEFINDQLYRIHRQLKSDAT